MQDWEYDRLKRCEANMKALELDSWSTVGETEKLMYREARMLVKHVERAKSGIESAIYELKDLENRLGDLTKLPEEPGVQ